MSDPDERQSGWQRGREWVAAQADSEWALRQRTRAARLLRSASGGILNGSIRVSDAVDNAAHRVGNEGGELPPPSDVVPVKAEKPSDTLTFTYDYRLVNAMFERLDERGVTAEEFLMAAYEFELGWRTFDGKNPVVDEIDENARLIAYRHDFSMGTNRLTLSNIHQRYGAKYNEMNGERKTKFVVNFDEEQVASIMFGIGFGSQGRHTDDVEKLGDRGFQLGQMGSFTASAMRHYLARLDAEDDGWTFMIDRNMGDEMMIPLGRIGTGGDSGAEA